MAVVFGQWGLIFAGTSLKASIWCLLLVLTCYVLVGPFHVDWLHSHTYLLGQTRRPHNVDAKMFCFPAARSSHVHFSYAMLWATRKIDLAIFQSACFLTTVGFAY